MTDRGTNKDRASSCQRKSSQIRELLIQKIKGGNRSRQLIKLKKKKRRFFEIKVRIHSILQNNLKILHERNRVFQWPQNLNIINDTKNSNRSVRMASQSSINTNMDSSNSETGALWGALRKSILERDILNGTSLKR